MYANDYSQNIENPGGLLSRKLVKLTPSAIIKVGSISDPKIVRVGCSENKNYMIL